MMAYVLKILINILLLRAFADGCKDQPDVRIGDKENIEIECGNKQQGREITWYTYGSVDHGLDVFTNVTSGMKYTVPSSGGIFTCTAETNKISVNAKEFCNSHKTIIIPPPNDTNENKDDRTYIKYENVTLQCHVNLMVSYALLWIATYRNETPKCLSSMEVIKTSNTFNITNNNLCCPIEGVNQRYNHTLSLHYLDNENITTSQSGEYLCIAFFYDKGTYKWKRLNQILMQVTNENTTHRGNEESTADGSLSPTPTSTEEPTAGESLSPTPTSTEESTADESCCPTLTNSIVYGIIGGLAALGIFLCLVMLCRKYKGKLRKVNHSYSNTVPTEYECTPYAVGVGRENIPHVDPNAEYSEIGMESEAKPIPVYSEVDMKLPVEPNSEYAEVGIDSLPVYSKIYKGSNKECSETKVMQAENDSCEAYSVVELKK